MIIYYVKGVIMKKTTLVFIVSLTFLTGCVAPTQYVDINSPNGNSGGYESYQIDKDSFIISASGNGVTSSKRVKDIALRNAAESCLLLDSIYTKFQVKDYGGQTNSSTINIPTYQNNYVSGNVITPNGMAMYSGTITTQSSMPMEVNRYSFKYVIKCVKDDDFGMDINKILYDTSYLVGKDTSIAYHPILDRKTAKKGGTCKFTYECPSGYKCEDSICTSF